MTEKASVQQKLRDGIYSLKEPTTGKSEIWKSFHRIMDKDSGNFIAGFVACLRCKMVYTHKSSDGTRTLLAHRASCSNSSASASRRNLNLDQKKNDVMWSNAGFKQQKEEKTKVMAADKEELNRKVVLWSALDYRPLQVSLKIFDLLILQ